MSDCERCPELLQVISSQQQRINKLAQEKAQAQLVADVLSDLARIQGIVPIATHTMQHLMTAIGGTHLTFYGKQNGHWLVLDVYGRHEKVTTIEDEMVREVIEKGEAMGAHSDSSTSGLFTMDTGMSTFEKWVFPLRVDDQVFGALCVDGLLVHLNDSIIEQLGIIASYIGLVLKNESLASSRLKKAYDSLMQKNEQLQREIEHRIQAENEKQRLQVRLQQSQKMEAIGTLAGGIAHDFNNLLSAIVGYTDLVYDTCPESENKHHLGQVLKASERAKELVNQILAFSRKQDMQRVPMHVAPVVREVMKLLRASIPSTIAIDVHVDNQCPPIMGNVTYIHQVIMNLCTNATHAMEHHGGRLLVSLQRDTDAQKEEIVRLSVSDSGTGIPADILPRIFDPYFTTKEIGKGTGMGLAVVHGIVNSLGGKIDVKSSEEKGTTVSCEFPVVHKKTQNQAASDDAAGLHCSGVAMVVDDETSIAHLAAEMLKKMGFEVDVFLQSSKALEAFMATPERYSLILTDQTMPEMTGTQLSRHITSQRWLPILISSGYSNAIEEAAFDDHKIVGFVPKPYKFSELKKMVALAVEKSQQTVQN